MIWPSQSENVGERLGIRHEHQFNYLYTVEREAINEMTTNSLPDYLASYDSLVQHFRGQFESLISNEKGHRFARFACRLIPQTEVGKRFDPPEIREKESHDEGVDLIANGKNGRSIMYVQSKLWLDRAESFDSVISKFHNYLTMYHSDSSGSQSELFPADEQKIEFMLISLSRLDGIISSYEKRSFTSKSFYDQLKEKNRIHVVDGSQILPILRGAYGKITELPTNLTLNLETNFVNKDNVLDRGRFRRGVAASVHGVRRRFVL